MLSPDEYEEQRAEAEYLKVQKPSIGDMDVDDLNRVIVFNGEEWVRTASTNTIIVTRISIRENHDNKDTIYFHTTLPSIFTLDEWASILTLIVPAGTAAAFCRHNFPNVNVEPFDPLRAIKTVY